jgi:Mg-chelatase subunit ChlD
VYVIDCSGSMIVSITNPKYEGGQPVPAGEESRMEATKAALIEVLGKLDSKDRFNIVCFNDLVTPYSDRLLEAKSGEIKAAQEWVSKLVASQSTNIHDAMAAAFKLAGRGARDKYYKSAVDTIFLLTDGSPTTNDGKIDSTDRILASVREWNPHKHVVVHTIGIGKDLNDAFLQRIADENGGRYVKQ